MIHQLFARDEKSAKAILKKLEKEDPHHYKGKIIYASLKLSPKQIPHIAGWKTFEYSMRDD